MSLKKLFSRKFSRKNNNDQSSSDELSYYYHYNHKEQQKLKEVNLRLSSFGAYLFR